MRALAWIVLTCIACVACADSPDSADGHGEPKPHRPRAPIADAGEAQDAETPMDAGETDAQLEVPAECNANPVTVCPDPLPHYADVAPIFAQRCSGCHNGNDGHWPLSTYQHVADWYGEIRAQMLACTMPPPSAGIEMPAQERQQILSWIRCGFPK